MNEGMNYFLSILLALKYPFFAEMVLVVSGFGVFKKNIFPWKKSKYIVIFKRFTDLSCLRLGISGPGDPPENIESYDPSDAERKHTHSP